MIGGPRTKAHLPLSQKHDKDCVWCIHALNYIAMQVVALCCCELLVLQAFCADRHCLVPAGSKLAADSFIQCRWPHPSAGGVVPQPVVLPSTLRGTPGTLAIFREG